MRGPGMSAAQRISQKTYVEMGESDMLLIEAYCFGFGLNAKQAADFIEWPWQSINQHLKVMNDRIDRKKDTLDHIMARAKETIAKLNLVRPDISPPKVKYAKKEEVEKLASVSWAKEEAITEPIKQEVASIVVRQEPYQQTAFDAHTPPAAQETVRVIHDELTPASCPPPFYMLALDDLIHQLRSGAIAFRSLFVDDERGVLELRYKKELQL